MAVFAGKMGRNTFEFRKGVFGLCCRHWSSPSDVESEPEMSGDLATHLKDLQEQQLRSLQFHQTIRLNLRYSRSHDHANGRTPKVNVEQERADMHAWLRELFVERTIAISIRVLG